MFNSSLRRAARTCPNAALAARHTSTSGSTASATFSTRTHQRRHSSSKPPIPPNNGSPPIPASSVKQVGAPRSADKRPGAESRLSKRKASKGEKPEQVKQPQEGKGNEWTLSLPSVPSTQHLNPKDVYIASFFSTHRPISISGPLPPETQIEDFEKIFTIQPKRKPKNTADVIYTLSNAVRNIDEHIQNQQQDLAVEQRADLIKTLTQQNSTGQNQAHHLDGQQQIKAPGNMKLVIEEIAKRFRPFNTPPPPEPMPEIEIQVKERSIEKASISNTESDANEELQARQLEAEVESQDTKSQPHIITLTPGSSTLKISSGSFFTPKAPVSDPNAVAHVVDPVSRSQPARPGRSRRGVYVDPTKRYGIKYYAISVKRQRKAKMKKHKYKKLMRKTRNIRRRQDRL